jgi:hypothetical protein
LCSINKGEFLFWSIRILMNYVNKCEICNELDVPTDDLPATDTDKNNRIIIIIIIIIFIIIFIIII